MPVDPPSSADVGLMQAPSPGVQGSVALASTSHVVPVPAARFIRYIVRNWHVSSGYVSSTLRETGYNVPEAGVVF